MSVPRADPIVSPPIRHRAAVLAAALATAALVGCQDGRAADPRPVVGVSVLPQAYAVERIAGELVRVEVMIPPGASPVTHEPGVAQLKDLGEAALYVKVGHPGFPFEAAWLDRLLAAAPHLRVLDGSAGATLRDDDPHVWLAPAAMEQMAIRIEAALREILPEQRDVLAANLADFRGEIAALDRELRDALAGGRQRTLLVFHPAWGYFAEAYGLEQVAIEHQHKEPDPYELAALIERAREERIEVVFVQPQFDPASAETLARAIGARVEPLDPLAYDWPAGLRRVAQLLSEQGSE